ncbi:hypothetical protein [Synechocystis sp. PCC 7509]|uniref:hypothetical protein n=1 Tax=Synechocystis sp. PCC 7509 TaxID=927677 RepID=UPI0002AD1008|nr:hypothetical protein [Synechocystis sp. PCC 7509]
MTPQEIAIALAKLFEPTTITTIAPGSWQIEQQNLRLLVLLSEDHSWLRILVPIISAQVAKPFMEQFLESNFDDTQEVRYALHQGVVWGIYQHSRESLIQSDLTNAIARLVALHQTGITGVFNQLVESRIGQIVQTAKQQGQSLENTLQTLDRFYEEGVLGDLEQNSQSREQILQSWRRQLERMWAER